MPESQESSPALPEWVAELLAEHNDRLHCLCFRLAGNAADEDDLANDAITAVLRKWSQYDRDLPFWPWLLAIVCNRWATIKRKRGSNHLSLDDEVEAGRTAGPVASEPPPLNGLVGREDASRLRTAIGRLHPDERALVELYYFEGLDCTTIAGLTSRPVGTIHRMLHTARRRLAEAFPERTPAGG